jgi:hypothetical protein
LQLSNAQSNEEYQNEAAMIPANTSLIVRRVPVKSRVGGKKFEQAPPPPVRPSNASTLQGSHGAPSMPLLAGGSEQERLEALVSQGPGWSASQTVVNRPRFMQGGCSAGAVAVVRLPHITTREPGLVQVACLTIMQSKNVVFVPRCSKSPPQNSKE